MKNHNLPHDYYKSSRKLMDIVVYSPTPMFVHLITGLLMIVSGYYAWNMHDKDIIKTGISMLLGGSFLVYRLFMNEKHMALNYTNSSSMMEDSLSNNNSISHSPVV